MLSSYILKKAIADYYSLIRVITGKTFGGSRKAVANAGYVNYTSIKDRCYYFEYKSLKGTIYQDKQGNMQINDFLYVLDGFSDKYIPFYSVEQINECFKEAV
ncbi:MAG: hypothetical protein JEZ08_22370 [Clostridiales bacterium]|nr:hypothetical protein [Clostridiales bacterium]